MAVDSGRRYSYSLAGHREAHDVAELAGGFDRSVVILPADIRYGRDAVESVEYGHASERCPSTPTTATTGHLHSFSGSALPHIADGG